MDGDDILLHYERRSRESAERVKGILVEMGRPDLADELAANLRDVQLGLTTARSIWHSISPAQRKLLAMMSEGRRLVRCSYSRTRFDAIGESHAVASACGIATVRALCARDLLACDGTTLDPESRIVLTEHGRFVVKHGPSPT